LRAFSLPPWRSLEGIERPSFRDFFLVLYNHPRFAPWSSLSKHNAKLPKDCRNLGLFFDHATAAMDGMACFAVCLWQRNDLSTLLNLNEKLA
jgi:hypothetical protein